MKKERINIALTLLALLPMTFFLFVSIYGAFNILSSFDFNDTLILISLIFGILGYVGLLMNLKQNKELKAESINFIFLLLGIVGFILFNSFEGGLKAWKWILMIEDPDEWLMFVGPTLITILLIVTKGKRLTTLYNRNTGENDKIKRIDH
ncbi:hypothetical protein OO013_17250 [Mangrovivirga sp. M17]|uniref:DUF4293 family protein n=1 Tax=Mangrovivirga halotolerans TaxID=2993936 RepID=A0ABT3RVN5_9BACT|nr:hypothetical protein [Mangrovivirga halotolerans]MCX2745632.1 hypothetical protein [Mangrovivirga halotolerans]